MVCGNVVMSFKERIDEATMSVACLTLYVLTMDNTGHIIWPTNFTPGAKAALRMQARALLRKMIDDPHNPCDSTMLPALTGTGTSSVWEGAPRRQLLIVQPAAQ